jgi:ferric-dicitrate binding protein FerR (iron transport regulator)
MLDGERVAADPTAERFRRERRSQLRGLLLLALAALGFLLWRAQPLLLFHRDWWRP